MLYTSGQHQRPKLANRVHEFMLIHEPVLQYSTITVHHCRLKSQGVTGWQMYESYEYPEFIIEIDRSLNKTEYTKTLIHEHIHCRQDMEGILTTDELREEEAYRLEKILYSIYIKNTS
jgi:hypothetical protein